MEKVIYADNAATTKLNDKAYEAMQPFLRGEYGNPSQPYSFSRSVKVALKNARQSIADILNAEPDEIVFTSGGTESDNWALKGAYFSTNRRKTIVTSSIEHHAVVRSCKFINHLGGHVNYLEVDEAGRVAADKFQSVINDDVCLASIMLANNEIGTIQDVKDFADIAHRKGVLFHTDAVQAVGHIKVNVKELGIDMLSASAHKFGGPKGVGFLYLKKGTEIFPYFNGGAQEFHMRAGTENVAGIVGMAVALQESVVQSDSQYLRMLESRIIQKLITCGLSSGNDFVINGDAKNKLPGVVSLSFKEADGEMLLHRLDLAGIMVSTGAACDSTNTQVSHVIDSIGLSREYARGTIRISLGYQNTIEESDKIGEVLGKIIKGQRGD